MAESVKTLVCGYRKWSRWNNPLKLQSGIEVFVFLVELPIAWSDVREWR